MWIIPRRDVVHIEAIDKALVDNRYFEVPLPERRAVTCRKLRVNFLGSVCPKSRFNLAL